MSWESPAVAVIEQTLCRWSLDLLGLPTTCGVGVVTGGTVANTQAIMAARDALLARHCALAEYLAAKLTARNGIEIMNDVVSNQVAIACRDDAQTVAVLDRVQARGRVYPSHGEWRGRKIIRASIINHATDQADIDLLASEILTACREIG